MLNKQHEITIFNIVLNSEFMLGSKDGSVIQGPRISFNLFLSGFWLGRFSLWECHWLPWYRVVVWGWWIGCSVVVTWNSKPSSLTNELNSLIVNQLINHIEHAFYLFRSCLLLEVSTGNLVDKRNKNMDCIITTNWDRKAQKPICWFSSYASVKN